MVLLKQDTFMAYQSKTKTDKHRMTTPWMTVEQWLNMHPIYQSLWNISKCYSISLANILRSCWCVLEQKNKYVNRVDAYAKKVFYKHENIFTFLKALILNPHATGAICPSSKHLAEEMVSHVRLDSHGIVVELGAGTGVVTEELLRSGMNPKKIIAIEYSHELVKKLRDRFPAMRIIEGNAADLTTLLGDNAHKVNTVISSLPLRSLPTSLAKSILEQIKTVLPENGRYIQFTYSFRQNKFTPLQNFKQIYSKRIWLNIPPARVDVWVKYRD